MRWHSASLISWRRTSVSPIVIGSRPARLRLRAKLWDCNSPTLWLTNISVGFAIRIRSCESRCKDRSSSDDVEGFFGEDTLKRLKEGIETAACGLVAVINSALY